MGSPRYRLPWTHWLHPSPATVQGGRTKVCGRVASVFPEYMAPAPVAKLRHASVCCGSHFSRFYSACRTRSCGGASACGVCFFSSCSVCRISSCGGARRSSAYTCHCRETHYSRSCSVCRTCSCGGVHRSSTSGKLRSASAYNSSCRGLSWNTFLLQLLQGMPHQLLWC